MGLIKPYNYSKKDVIAARLGRAISHPVRAKMIRLMMKRGYTMKELAHITNLCLSSVRNHLAMLRDANLLISEYKTHFMLFSVDREKYRRAHQIFLELEECDDDDTDAKVSHQSDAQPQPVSVLHPASVRLQEVVENSGGLKLDYQSLIRNWNLSRFLRAMLVPLATARSGSSAI